MTRFGQVAFFSHTDVENIEAVNNQTVCTLNTDTGDIVVHLLMRAFVFKNTLMRDHFNDSYIESDFYPKAIFKGKIIDFDPTQSDIQIRMIKGQFTLRNQTAPLTFKVKIGSANESFILSGITEVFIENYNIKIPKLLSPNIAKSIQVSFDFECIAQKG